MNRKILLYIAIWIGSLILISFYGGTASYAIFFGVTLIPVLSLLYIAAVILCFRIYQKTDVRTMQVDDETGYFFVIENNYPYAFSGMRVIPFSNYFTLHDQINSEAYTLLPGEKVSFNTKISCKYRGEYPIGVRAVEISDFLGLFKIIYKLPDVPKAIVHPKIVQLEELMNTPDESVTSIPSNYIGSDIIDASVRSYERGDSLNRIHWKASAKTGELKVRNIFEEKKRGILIYFDGKRISNDESDYLPYENKVLEVVIAVTRYFAWQNEEVDIIQGTKEAIDEKSSASNSGKGTSKNGRGTINNSTGTEHTINSPSEFDKFYVNMCSFTFDEEYDSVAALSEFENTCVLKTPKIAYIVVGEISEELLMVTDRLNALSINIVIYLVTDKWDERVKTYSNEYRKIVMVGNEADISEII